MKALQGRFTVTLHACDIDLDGGAQGRFRETTARMDGARGTLAFHESSKAGLYALLLI